LLSQYVEMLERHGQKDEAKNLGLLLEHPEDHFIQVVPVKEQADPAVSTE
jgi:glutamate synthase (NADPH) large chain